MEELGELRDLIGPEFQTNITMHATLGGHVLEYGLDLTAMAVAGVRGSDSSIEAYTEITRRFGELYVKLMSHERWTATQDPSVRVRFVEAEHAHWRLNGTIVRRATYYVQGEGEITLVRTSRDGHE